MALNTVINDLTTSRRRRVWEVVQVAKPGDVLSRAFDTFILTLILLNVLAVVLESVQELTPQFGAVFAAFEVFSLSVFVVEYFARLWSCVEDPRFSRPIVGRMRYMIRPLAIIDLLAILPAVFTLGAADLRILRALRLFRLVRVAKAARYVAALVLFKHVVRSKREELALTSALMFVLLLIASALMYFAENEAQPDKFSSIPASMWWAVATLTTVGYGDVYPVTIAGKLAGAVVAILGIGFFALPTAIIGSGFVEAVQQQRDAPKCPHCGNPIT